MPVMLGKRRPLDASSEYIYIFLQFESNRGFTSIKYTLFADGFNLAEVFDRRARKLWLPRPGFNDTADATVILLFYTIRIF